MTYMDKEITYFLYHIPGKKIGVTRNLIDRVTTQQGYTLDEIEVLDQSTDIDYISSRELELQKSYGYRVDLKPYKQLFKMKINATEQTSTFPVPLNKLKGRLMDSLGLTWETIHGKFEVTKETIEWIMKHASTSMFNKNRSYIYNKAFYEAFLNEAKNEAQLFYDQLKDRPAKQNGHAWVDSDRFQLIRDWAGSRGLYSKGDTKTQFCKLMEEAGELGRAILKDDEAEFVDAIGDMVVVLTNLAHLGGTTIEDCIDSAYKVISKRKGKMVNGTFVKDDNNSGNTSS
jgi:NTP pyrophosphatase (non-canonical NTP hydrolase)